jgi:NADH dehydrogenase
MKVISIFGGTGFIGTELVTQLAKMPFKIQLFTRNKKRLDQLRLGPRIELIEFSMKKNFTTKLNGSDVIINLVGILHEGRRIKFSKVHEEFVENLINFALKKNIKRIIHISALGVSSNSVSKYLLSKYNGEGIIQDKFKMYDWTILRPSIVFGPHDKFINLFKKMVKFLPLILLVSPKAEFQPIYINDLVEIIIKSIDDKKTYKKIFNIGGPKKFTFYEIVKLITLCNRRKNFVIGLNKTLSYFFVRLLQLSPIKIITLDNLKSMETSNTVKINDSYKFKSSLKELSTYLINEK